MSTLNVRKMTISTMVLFVSLALALALLAGFSVRSRATAADSSTNSVFNCTPSTVATFTNRVHVSCNPAAPNNIVYFAYCSTHDSATANRFLSVFTTAKAIGKNLYIYYDPSDTSGTQCGCGSGDCRVITGAEVRP